MAKLIVLRGNSGSGKTTLAALLQEKIGPNTMRISHDTVRMQMLHVSGREGVEKSLPLMIELVRYGAAHSKVTVLEGILPAKDYGPLFDACAEAFGREIYAYYYDLPFEVTLRRHATKPNRASFGEEEMRRWWQAHDLLAQFRETVFDETVTLEDALARILRDIGFSE